MICINYSIWYIIPVVHLLGATRFRRGLQSLRGMWRCNVLLNPVTTFIVANKKRNSRIANDAIFNEGAVAMAA